MSTKRWILVFVVELTQNLMEKNIFKRRGKIIFFFLIIEAGVHPCVSPQNEPRNLRKCR